MKIILIINILLCIMWLIDILLYSIDSIHKYFWRKKMNKLMNEFNKGDEN